MELPFIKPQENILVWILLTVVCMERLGKITALFRNIKAGRDFGVDNYTPSSSWRALRKRRMPQTEATWVPVLLWGSFCEGMPESSRRRFKCFCSCKVLEAWGGFVSHTQTFVHRFLCVTLESWQILLAVVTFSFQQLWWHAVGFTVVEGGGTLIWILYLAHSLIAVLFYPLITFYKS